jgi:HJR/Mrr/RecB family endonuclease
MDTSKRTQTIRRVRSISSTVTDVCVLLVNIYLCIRFPALLTSGAMLILVPTTLICAGLLLWPVLAKQKRQKKEREHFLSLTMDDIDQMDEPSFEAYIKFYFERLDYTVSILPDTGTFREFLMVSGDGSMSVILAKCTAEKINSVVVEETADAKDSYAADHAIIVTNSTFTGQAVTLANERGVELWDRTDVMELFFPDSKDNGQDMPVSPKDTM